MRKGILGFGKHGSENPLRRADHLWEWEVTRKFLGPSNFRNFGYWTEGVHSQSEACECLIEKLLAFIPQKQGTILDVACGMGATSKYLLRYYQPSAVIGVDISQRRLQTCRLNGEEGRFLCMDAAKLGFGDSVFDNIICVEAPTLFDTREAFLREAYRVLKPGGHLVLSDVLFRRWVYFRFRRGWIWKKENYLSSLRDYEKICKGAGFRHVEVVDATDECWIRFYRHLRNWGWNGVTRREINLRSYCFLLLAGLLGQVALGNYLLISARKSGN